MTVAIASLALVLLLVLSYLGAWSHRLPMLVLCLIGAIAVAVFCDTALTPLLVPSGATGLERFLEVGPAFILGASVVVCYYYAWKRMIMHVMVCVLLAAATIVLGW